MKSMRFWMVGLVLAGLLLAGWQAVVAEEQQYDFRKTRWGMSKIEVKMAEKEAVPSDTNEFDPNTKTLFYKTEYAGYQVRLLYGFKDNLLIGGTYFLDQNYNELEEYVKTFEKLKNELIKTHGQPTKELWWQKEKNKKFNRDNYGKAIARKELRIGSQWTLRNRNIDIVLWADNQMNLRIKYSKR